MRLLSKYNVLILYIQSGNTIEYECDCVIEKNDVIFKKEELEEDNINSPKINTIIEDSNNLIEGIDKDMSDEDEDLDDDIDI